MATAKKLKSGSWRVQVFSHYEFKDGKKKKIQKSFTAPTKKGAELLAAQYLNSANRIKTGRVTVGDAISRYIDSRKNTLSPSTVKTYREDFERHTKTIQNILVSDLTSEDLQFFIDSLAVDLSPKTVKNIYGLVTAALKSYSDKVYRVTLPARSPSDFSIPTDKDIMLLMEKATPRLKICIALSALGTLRRGEICGLTYKDVLYDFSAVYVHSDMVMDESKNWIHKDMPKNSSSIRRVTLPAAVIEMLGRGDPDEYIYKGTPSSITNKFCKLRDRLGLKCRFHDLRHYSASILHVIGVPDQYIMQRGGWATDSTLKAVYRNTLEDKEKRFTDKANNYFNDAFFKDSANS